ncbi:MAG: DUF1330 domain-containing protein [Spirochaetota bacterium]
MAEAKVSMVVTAIPNPEQAEDMKAYLSQVVPILKGHGGEIITRGKADKAIVGEVNFAMVLLMNFPSTEAIETAFASAEYQKIVPHRDRGFKKMDVVVLADL